MLSWDFIKEDYLLRQANEEDVDAIAEILQYLRLYFRTEEVESAWEPPSNNQIRECLIGSDDSALIEQYEFNQVLLAVRKSDQAIGAIALYRFFSGEFCLNKSREPYLYIADFVPNLEISSSDVLPLTLACELELECQRRGIKRIEFNMWDVNCIFGEIGSGVFSKFPRSRAWWEDFFARG